MTARKLAGTATLAAPAPIAGTDVGEASVTAIIADLAAVDRDGDTYLPGAFTGNTEVLISQWGHAAWQPGFLPVGSGAITEENGLAIFRGTFLPSQAARETYATLRALGSRVSWSYGYDVTDERAGIRGARRTIAGVTVLEVSPVLRPAGVGTATIATGGRDLGSEEAAREFARFVAAGLAADLRREVADLDDIRTNILERTH